MCMRVICQTILMAALLTGCVQAEKPRPSIRRPGSRLLWPPNWRDCPPSRWYLPRRLNHQRRPILLRQQSSRQPKRCLQPEQAHFHTSPWTPSQCDYSAFITDLDITDYSKVTPGTVFTKTWRIKNIGTCAAT